MVIYRPLKYSKQSLFQSAAKPKNIIGLLYQMACRLRNVNKECQMIVTCLKNIFIKNTFALIMFLYCRCI
jgi:hypothetical protein